MAWYAAHLIQYFRYQDGTQDIFPIYENMVLIEADSSEQAFEKANEIGHQAYNHNDPTLTVDGVLAKTIYGGIRKIIECQSALNGSNDPTNGLELTYSKFIVTTEDALAKFINGDNVDTIYLE